MIYFCPICHKQIVPPEYLKQIKGTGDIKIICGQCKKGEVKIVLDCKKGNADKTKTTIL